MSQKSEKVGVVVSNKMQKSIVVAVEWQVRQQETAVAIHHL